MNKRATNIFLLILAVVLFIFIVGVSVIANNLTSRHLAENVSDRLVAAVQPSRTSFEQQIEEQIKKVKTMAQFFANNGSLGDKSQLDLMRIAVEENRLLRCAVVDTNGDFISHAGETGSVKDEVFFESAMQGRFTISDPQQALAGADNMVIFFTAPIRREGEVIGALIYSYPCDEIDEIFNLDFLNGNGHVMVINSKGFILIGGREDALIQGENALEYLRETCVHTDHQAAECMPVELGALAQSIYAIQTLEETSGMLVNCEKLEYNDWYMLAVVPVKSINETIFVVTDIQRGLAIIVFACVLFYVLAVIAVRIALVRNHDSLTHAPRLEYFKRIAKKVLKRNKGQRFIFVKLDVKDFKLINRIYDFKQGDRVIQNMALSLSDTLKGLDASYARVEADVFVIMLPFVNKTLLDEKRQAFINTFRKLMGSGFTTYTNFPTGQYVTDERDAARPNIAEILEKANFAHSLAKRRQSDMIVDYEDAIEREALIQKEIEDKMDEALKNNDYRLYIQPKIRVKDECLCGGEALVRWIVGGVPYMHPADFVPALERNGFIVKLDMYMFEHAVAFISGQMNLDLDPMPLAVNFSRHHLSNLEFVQGLVRITQKYDVPTRLLEIELTESTMFENLEQTLRIIDELHAAGFRVAMDDFGSGYSSLGFLKDVKVDIIKIDKNFFAPESDHERNRVVLSHMFAMAKDLKTETVAEGVEHKEQVEMLRTLGCDVIQGFFFDRPMPAETFQHKFFETEE